MIKLLLAVVAAAVILLLIIVTIAGVLEAREMQWDNKTIIKKEDEDEDQIVDV